MILQKCALALIRYSFDTAVFIIELFSNMEPYKKRLEALRNYETGTLGSAIANCLDAHRYNLVPRFESHDLKHVLLNYGMDPIGEIRLQAFMVGNGNRTLPSLAILTYGMILLPSQWKTFKTDYQKGCNTPPISHWTVASHGQYPLETLQRELLENASQHRPVFSLKKITKLGAFTSILAGVLGMFYCLPYLFSSQLEDLVGAGFPFLGGAILAVGGLIVLSNLARKVPAVK